MTKIDDSINSEFQQIRQAIEEHLTAINENTGEIQALFDYLQEVENKIEKISQRLDQLQLHQGANLTKPVIIPLDQIEKKIFLTLYTEETPLSYKEIAEKSQVPGGIISDCLTSLIHKGIPLQRTFSGNQLFLQMEPGFKELQAKENLINLSLQSFLE